MKYCIVATKYGDKENKWLTNELADIIQENGHEVHVLALSWLESDEESSIKYENGIFVYRCKLPSIFYKKNILIKYIKQIVFPIYAYYKYKSKLKKIKPEKLIAFTPSHLVYYIVTRLCKYNYISSYLVLWDFFPFYLNDLNKKGLLFRCLRKFENMSYLDFDKIGVMTEENKRFLLNNYNGISEKNIDILPIWAKVNNVETDVCIRKKYGFNVSDFIFVYGGAHSHVQELDNILELAKLHLDNIDVKFVFIGKGEDKERLQARVDFENIYNVKFIDFVPRSEYEKLIKSMDVGLVSLSRKMEVPSFPSKSLDYLKCGLPILASIDKNTDYGEFLSNEMKCGYYSYAGDSQSLYKESIKFLSDTETRIQMGINGRCFFEDYFSVSKTYNIINGIVK